MIIIIIIIIVVVVIIVIIIVVVVVVVFSRIRPLGLFRFRIYFLKLMNLLDSW